MHSSSAGPVGASPVSGSTGVPRQRWAWTHRYGVALLVASVVAVVLSGSGLAVTVFAFGSGENGNGTWQQPTATPAASPPPDCEVGSWRAVMIEEDIDTGNLELLDTDQGPAFIYREDGTGEIDFGERTTFLFHDRLFGDFTEPTEQYLTGAVRFDYTAGDGALRHTYLDITEGARMIADPLPIPDVWYVPRGESFTYECDAETMVLDADSEDYFVELRRVGS